MSLFNLSSHTVYAPSDSSAPAPRTVAEAVPTTKPSLADNAMLADLSIGIWSAARHDARVTQEVADTHNSDVNMGSYRKHLVAKEAMASLRSVASAAAAEHRRRTLPWLSNGGGNILKSSGYLDYVAVMTDYQTQYESLVETFCLNYDAYVLDAKQRLNGLFRPEDYPTSRQIRSKFYFRFEFLPVPVASDFRANLSDSQVEHIRAEIAKSEAARLQQANRVVAERVKEVVGHMVERLTQYDPNDSTARLFDSTVENVRRLAKLLPTLNMADDPEIAAIGKQMESLGTFSADTLKQSGAARGKTAAAAAAVMAQMESFL